MNTQTEPKKTWSKIRSLKDIKHGPKIQLLEHNILISENYEVSNKLGEYFFDNSSD